MNNWSTPLVEIEIKADFTKGEPSKKKLSLRMRIDRNGKTLILHDLKKYIKVNLENYE